MSESELRKALLQKEEELETITQYRKRDTLAFFGKMKGEEFHIPGRRNSSYTT